MYSNPISKSIFKNYQESFDGDVIGIRSPGRVNIIGEHTDYNEGFVLPAAIDKATYVAIGKRDDENIRLMAADYNEVFETNLSSIIPGKGWPNYILGVVDQLIKRGHRLQGFNLFLAFLISLEVSALSLIFISTIICHSFIRDIYRIKDCELRTSKMISKFIFIK